MNAKWLIVGLSITFAAASGTLASDKVKGSKAAKGTVTDKVKTAQPGTPQAERDVLLTGSHLKQNFRRSGRITDAASNVEVIDRAAIDRSGAADLKQVLALAGVR